MLGLLVLTAFLAAVAALEQQRTVSGVVTDANGPVAGARVRYQGATGPAVTSDARGIFRLPVPAKATAAGGL